MAKRDCWSKFYWGDWRKDSRLARCSRAAKGAWMDFLAFVFDLDEPGYAIERGEVLTLRQIAEAMTGNQDEFVELMGELVGRGIVLQDDRGAYYSKRMAYEYHIRDVRSKAGKEGVKAKNRHSDSDNGDSDILLKQKVQQKVQQVVPVCLQQTSNSGSNSNSGSERKEKKENRFDEFWAKVPNKIGKGAARVAYAKAIAGGATHDEIVAGIEGYWQYEAKREKQQDYRPLHPATWLNGERWTDEVAGGSVARSVVTAAKWDSLGADTHRELLSEVQSSDPGTDHTMGNMDTQRAMRKLAKQKGLL